MTKTEYLTCQLAQARISEIVAELPLEEFLEWADRADALGPIIDPTLYKEAYEDLGKVRALAVALLGVKALRLKMRESQPPDVQIQNSYCAGQMLRFLITS